MSIPQAQHKRLILFAGPHKSASSTVQEFFMRHASDKRKKHPMLQNWTWPYNPRYKRFLPRKGFAPLVVKHDDAELTAGIYGRLKGAWQNATATGGILFGSEEFDRFGPCPWSHRNATHAIHEVLEILQHPKDFTIVVNYRLPRADHWISIWKQLTRTHYVSYRDYICNTEQRQDDVMTWEYLDAVANPLGLAYHFRSNGWNVQLVDMAGVAEAKLDVANVVACEILGVPCDDGWLVSADQQILQNRKSGDPELSETQLHEIEELFLQRDCTYRQLLEDDPNFSVIHKDQLWARCDSLQFDDASRDTTVLLNKLRSQVKCDVAAAAPPDSNREDESAAQRNSQHHNNHGENFNGRGADVGYEHRAPEGELPSQSKMKSPPHVDEQDGSEQSRNDPSNPIMLQRQQHEAHAEFMVLVQQAILSVVTISMLLVLFWRKRPTKKQRIRK